MSVNASTITTVGRKTTAWRALISVPNVFTHSWSFWRVNSTRQGAQRSNPGVTPYKNNGGARRTFQGFKFVDCYRLFVVVELVPPRAENEFAHAHKTRFWYLLEVFSKFSDEHPHHFYREIPLPLPPGNLAYQKDVFFFYLADISYACHQDLRR